VEVGYADLYPHNTFNGGGPDSMSLRFVVTGGDRVVADFIAHSHADSTCQCATVEGWASDGSTRVNFTVPYNIPPLGDGNFPGEFRVTSPAIEFRHVSTLPGPGRSTATANLFLKLGDDSITTLSGLLRPHAGRLDGETEIRIQGEHFAAVTNRQFLARMLSNLKVSYWRREQWDKVVAVIDRLLVLHPEAGGERRDRGFALSNQGEVARGLADWERYLTDFPDAPDHEQVKGQLRRVRHRLARLN